MSGNQVLARPDLTGRPHGVVVQRRMLAPPAAIYLAWTQEIGSWFAEPGMVQMRAAEGEPFVFVTKYEGNFEPHYGRFLSLVADRLIELTWVTGRAGTAGAETVVKVELEPDGDGTLLRLTHSGFYDRGSAQRHKVAWGSHVLPHLDAVLTGGGPSASRG